MSLFREYTRRCDGCGALCTRRQRRTAAASLTAAMDVGWTQTRGYGRAHKDWCPDCTPKEPR